MIDINLIRKDPEKIKQEVAKKAFPADIDAVLSLDQKRRELIVQTDGLRAKRNQAAKEKNIEEGRKIKAQLDELEEKLKKAEADFELKLLEVPNLPLPNVPIGDESANQVVKKVGTPKTFDFTPRDHVELGEILDIIDIPRATKVSGSRFSYLKNEGVMLEFAILQYAYQRLIKAGFSPLIPPVLIKQEKTSKLGYWQAGGNENYYLVTDYQQDQPDKEALINPLYLIGTAEHAVVPMHEDETFEQKNMPQKYAAFSSAFRREAGTYGKDTRGILRVHQFDKLEMVAFVTPDEDEKVRREMLDLASKLVEDLGLPYQQVLLASRDLGFPSAETIDIETWIPTQNKYRETHSISTTLNFQARRLNIKYRKMDNSVEYVHILNGTVFAMGRIIIAILENYQQNDGSVVIPEVLRPYIGINIIKPK